MKMKTLTEKLASMTREQYERWLKRNGYSGLAAARMDSKYREAKRHPLDRQPAAQRPLA